MNADEQNPSLFTESPSPAEFRSLTQARAARDRLAEWLIGVLEDGGALDADDARERVDRVCQAGGNWRGALEWLRCKIKGPSAPAVTEGVAELARAIAWIAEQEAAQTSAARGAVPAAQAA